MLHAGRASCTTTSDTIAELARDWNADLLVVGTHGRRGASRLLLGSVAEHIARVAPCPLLLVRGGLTSSS